MNNDGVLDCCQGVKIVNVKTHKEKGLYILIFMTVTECNYFKDVRVMRICLYYWYYNSIEERS